MSTEITTDTLAVEVDAYVEARSARLSLEKKAADLKAIEDGHKEKLLTYMVTNGQSIVGSKLSAIALNTRIEPTAEDWGAIKDYVTANDAFDLYQNKLSKAAVSARWEAGEEIPGVGRFMVKTLSISKLKGQ